MKNLPDDKQNKTQLTVYLMVLIFRQRLKYINEKKILTINS